MGSYRVLERRRNILANLDPAYSRLGCTEAKFESATPTCAEEQQHKSRKSKVHRTSYEGILGAWNIVTSMRRFEAQSIILDDTFQRRSENRCANSYINP